LHFDDAPPFFGGAFILNAQIDKSLIFKSTKH